MADAEETSDGEVFERAEPELIVAANPVHPWDQLPGEPPSAYARFLVYLNLGISRTLADACQTVLDERQQNVTKRNTRKRPKKANIRRPTGQWAEDSAQWRWKDRAEAWDIWRLRSAAERVHATMTELYIGLAKHALESLAGCKRPTTWQEALRYFRGLADYVPQALTTRVETNLDVGAAEAGGAHLLTNGQQ